MTSGGDIYIDLEGPKRAILGVQRSTGACWTCDELGHYTGTVILSVTKASFSNVVREVRWIPGQGQTSEWKLEYKY